MLTKQRQLGYSLERKNYKIRTKQILELKNKISEIKILLDDLNSRLENREQKGGEYKDSPTEVIPSEEQRL